MVEQREGWRTLEIPNLSLLRSTMRLRLVGVDGLVVHRFSDKAQRIISAKQEGRGGQKKEPKDPTRDFLDCLHVIGERPTSMAELKKTVFGFPGVAFKNAAVESAAMTDDLWKKEARGAFKVVCSELGLVKLITKKPPVMRSDAVRIQNTADIRHRPMFEEWAVELEIIYSRKLVSTEQLYGWFINAGQWVGVGDMRYLGRSSTGSCGGWVVESASAREAIGDVPEPAKVRRAQKTETDRLQREVAEAPIVRERVKSNGKK